MKQKVLFVAALVMAVLSLTSCSSDDNDDWPDLSLLFKSVDEYDNPVSCIFYIFPEGNYNSIERVWDDGSGFVPTKCYAITSSGKRVLSIGWSTYSKFSEGYGEAVYSQYREDGKYPDLMQGNFYIVAIPDRSKCYKAKNISKPDRKKTTITKVVFRNRDLADSYFWEDYKEIPW